MTNEDLNSPVLEEARTPLHLFALKHGDTFVVADARGDILGEGDGLFQDDTRILSLFRLHINKRALVLLGGAVGQDNVLFRANLTNKPLPPIGGHSVPEGVIHIERRRLIWNTRLYERVKLTNYGQMRRSISLQIDFAADFRDMFEIRGVSRARRGLDLSPTVSNAAVILSYESLDGVLKTSAISFDPAPARIMADAAEFEVDLAPHEDAEIYIEVGSTEERPSRSRFRTASAKARYGMRSMRRRGATLRTSGRVFNEWLERSRADLALLTTELDTGPYPYAGIPWFSTAFGRDAIITALQMLWLDPVLARGVLKFLSAHQATETSPFFDAAPGKIMHETRKGEMARLRELPFAQYYGGVDTTPLFVMLAGAYAERTGDMELINALWPSLTAALDWIEGPGDSNGDGFVDYSRGALTGLANQGWKDSEDSVFHADGSDATGPIALVEVQGYVYAGFRFMSDLSFRRGDSNEADRWHKKAEALRAAVEKRFWIEELGTYALALDGEGRACRVRTSNPGHLLYSGLPSPERAASVADKLLGGRLNSGWGIRTLAEGEARYNPMSYHNGSVWPHDTALCAAGISRYGIREGVGRLLSGMFEAAVRFDTRLPELWCGFRRVAGEPPIPYPVACLPQAWASGAVFMIIQACLGLRIDGWRREIHVDHPLLPVGVDHLVLHGLALGNLRADLSFRRIGNHVVVDSGDIPIVSTVARAPG